MTHGKRSALICHSASPAPFVDRVEVEVRRGAADAIELTYFLEGALANLRIPPPQTPRRAEDLWRHTCFEAFIKLGNGPGYVEFNFAPSGEWAAFLFNRYRQRAAIANVPTPTIEVESADKRLALSVAVAGVAQPSSAGPMRIGICAVVEDGGGALSYWALRHPAAKPDFHHPDSFALQIDH